MVAQRTEGLARLAKHLVVGDKDAIKQQLAGHHTVDSRVYTAGHARRCWIDQEQTDAVFVAGTCGRTRRHHNQPCRLPTDHYRLFPRQRPPPIHRLGTGLYIVEVVVTLRLFESHCQLQLSTGNLGQQLVFLLVAAQLLK
ncbi:hypothetical protein D3C77_628640 [compost metagenome]